MEFVPSPPGTQRLRPRASLREMACVCGVSNLRVCLFLLPSPDWPRGAAGWGLPAGRRHLGHGGPHRLPGDRGCQPPTHHGRLHPLGHGGPAFSARLPGLLRGRPGEQVSAAVGEYPILHPTHGCPGLGVGGPVSILRGTHTEV